MQLDQLEITDDVEASEDFMPGTDFSFDTGLYPMNIDMAYLGTSKGGAASITVHLKEANGNRTQRETFYVTSGKAKGRKNTYLDRGGKKRLLPGMEAMNQMAIIATSKKLSQLSAEKKMIKLYDYDARKELPTEVPVLTELLNTQVLCAITKKRENKRQQVDGEWIDTADDRTFNEVSKFLHPDGRTVAETIGDQTTPEWRDKWAGKFGPDYVQDKFKAPAAGAGVEAASAAAAVSSQEANDSLFDD